MSPCFSQQFKTTLFLTRAFLSSQHESCFRIKLCQKQSSYFVQQAVDTLTALMRHIFQSLIFFIR